MQPHGGGPVAFIAALVDIAQEICDLFDVGLVHPCGISLPVKGPDNHKEAHAFGSGRGVETVAIHEVRRKNIFEAVILE